MTELATRMEQQVAVQKSGGRNVYQELEALRPQLARALPKALDADRFLRLVLTNLRTNRGLLNCSSDSLLGAVMSAAQLGLEVDNRGLAYLIPRGGQVSFQIGYKGMIDLATRSGRTLDVDAEVVYSNDFFQWEKGLKPKLKHKPVLIDRGEPIAAYAVARYRSGGASFVVLPKADIERRRKRGQGAQPAWQSDADAMWKKTAVRALSAFMPQNPEMALAYKLDDTVRTDVTTPVEDLPDPDDTSDVEEAIEIPAVPTAAGEPEVPDSTSEDGVDSGEGAIPLPPSPESPEDGLDLLSDEELASLCDSEKLSNNGSRAQVIARIRKHWQKLNLK